MSVSEIESGVYKRTDIKSLLAGIGTPKVIRVCRQRSLILYSQSFVTPASFYEPKCPHQVCEWGLKADI